MQSQFQELEKKNALLLQQIKLADEDSQKVRQESTKVIEQCDLTMNSIGEVLSHFDGCEHYWYPRTTVVRGYQ